MPSPERDAIERALVAHDEESRQGAEIMEAAARTDQTLGQEGQVLCTACGGPRSLAVHSAAASGVGVADHEFNPPEMPLYDFTVTVFDGHGHVTGYVEEGYSADGVLTQLGESPERRHRAAERYTKVAMADEAQKFADNEYHDPHDPAPPSRPTEDVELPRRFTDPQNG